MGARGFDARRLKAERTAIGLTQGSLARAAGLHENEIGYYEAGRRIPKVETVAALARAMQIPPARLLASQDNERPSLLELRTLAGLSQKQAADAGAMPRGTYAAIERGEIVAPSDSQLAAIAKALDASVDQVRVAHSVSRAEYLDRTASSGRSGRTHADD
jgi:transcriptional regulator with XRE-family HTH domain